MQPAFADVSTNGQFELIRRPRRGDARRVITNKALFYSTASDKEVRPRARTGEQRDQV